MAEKMQDLLKEWKQFYSDKTLLMEKRNDIKDIVNKLSRKNADDAVRAIRDFEDGEVDKKDTLSDLKELGIRYSKKNKNDIANYIRDLIDLIKLDEAKQDDEEQPLEEKKVKSAKDNITTGDTFKVDHPEGGEWDIEVVGITYSNFSHEFYIDLKGKNDKGKTNTWSVVVKDFEKSFLKYLIK